MRCRALLAVAALAVAATTSASCLSPTLPLPPPDLPDSVMQNASGYWQISGNCLPGALVSILDTRTGLGVLYEDMAKAGVYTVTLPGAACDGVWVEQETPDQGQSAYTEFQLEPYSQGVPTNPDACP